MKVLSWMGSFDGRYFGDAIIQACNNSGLQYGALLAPRLPSPSCILQVPHWAVPLTFCHIILTNVILNIFSISKDAFLVIIRIILDHNNKQEIKMDYFISDKSDHKYVIKQVTL